MFFLGVGRQPISASPVLFLANEVWITGLQCCRLFVWFFSFLILFHVLPPQLLLDVNRVNIPAACLFETGPEGPELED